MHSKWSNKSTFLSLSLLLPPSPFLKKVEKIYCLKKEISIWKRDAIYRVEYTVRGIAVEWSVALALSHASEWRDAGDRARQRERGWPGHGITAQSTHNGSTHIVLTVRHTTPGLSR